MATGGFKLGGNVNIGNNPSFAPQLTGAFATSAPANLVLGDSNILEGNYNVVFGKGNTISGASDANCNLVVGTGSKIGGGVASTLLAYEGEIESTASYSLAMGYQAKVKAGALAGIALGYGATCSGGTTATAIGATSEAFAPSSVGLGGGKTSGGGQYSVAIGFEASGTAERALAFVGGTATALKSMALGSGSNAQTEGCVAIGRGTMGAGRFGGFRLNANGGASPTDSYQICQSIGTTTDATPTAIYLSDQNASDGRLIIATGTCLHFELIVQGTLYTSDSVGCIYKFEGVINRANGASDNPAFLGSVSKTVIHESDAGMDAALTIDNTNKSLELTVTGKAATQLHWLGTWHIHQNK